MADPGFWIRGSNLRNSGQSCQFGVTLQLTYFLHAMIEINIKNEICESRTPTLMISLEVDFVNVYYNILILIVHQLFIQVGLYCNTYLYVHDTYGLVGLLH